MLVLNQCVLKQSVGGDLNPADLFEGGTYKGWWFDASDLSTLKQDSGGTTAVTADGDPVKYWASKAGGSGTATLSNGSSGAVLDVVSGNNAVFFGTDDTDKLSSNSTMNARINGVSSFTYMLVADLDTVSADRAIFAMAAASYANETQIYMTPSGSFNYFSAGNDAWIGNASNGDARVKTVWTVERYADNSSPRIKVYKAADVTGSGGTATTSVFSSGDSPVANLMSAVGHVYQFYFIDRILPSDTRLQLQRALGAKAGVTV